MLSIEKSTSRSGKLLVIISRDVPRERKMPIHRLTRVNPVRDAARDARPRKQEVIIEERTASRASRGGSARIAAIDRALRRDSLVDDAK